MIAAIEWLLVAAVAGGIGCDGPRPAAAPDPSTGRPAAAAASLRLVLNIPAYRLDVFQGGERRRSYTVAVGSRRYPTPTGSYRVDLVTWNPWWYPPDSDWARKEKPTPPGPDNPVGKVKLQFRPLYFLHGTPYESSLGSAASHGCVRLASRDAVELARLVHEQGSPELPPAALDSLGGASLETVSIPLSLPVPLTIGYEVAELRDGSLEIHPDVYRKVAGGVLDRALEVLREGGYSLDQIDHARLETLVRRARTTQVSVPVEELLAPGWTEPTRPQPSPKEGSDEHHRQT